MKQYVTLTLHCNGICYEGSLSPRRAGLEDVLRNIFSRDLLLNIRVQFSFCYSVLHHPAAFILQHLLLFSDLGRAIFLKISDVE